MTEEFISKVSKFIDDNRMFSQKDKVILGVSGGADSVALLVTMAELAPKYELDLTVVTINHGLRPEAEAESNYVGILCKERDISFAPVSVDVHETARKLHIGTEEAGRYLRYQVFEKLAGDRGKIAIAHNLNDRAETMLFHLSRGTGPRGMAAIKAVNQNRVRPLLCVSRAEIEDFLKSRNISFCMDETNSRDIYTRNIIRNRVLPILTGDVNPLAINHIAKASELIESQNDFIHTSALMKYDEILVCERASLISINRDDFTMCHPAVRREIVKIIIDKIAPGNKDITQAHIDSAMDLAVSEGNHEINLPYEITAYTQYEELCFERNRLKEELSDDTYALTEGIHRIPGLGVITVTITDRPKDFVIIEKPYTKWFDYDKIKNCPVLRHRANGDYLTVTPNMGRKKIKDYFIDKKVVKDERDRVFLVTDKAHVIWAIGYRISEYFKVNEETKRVMCIEVSKEEK